LSFIAQINLEEAREYDRDKLLPPTEMLLECEAATRGIELYSSTIRICAIGTPLA